MKATDTIEGILKQSSFFRNLSSDEIEKVAPGFELRKYQKNNIIVHEDEIADCFFIVQSGTVEIWKNYEEKKSSSRLSVKTTGDVFGEMALIDDEPRSATAISTEKTQLLCISKHDFFAIFDKYPQIMFGVLKTLSSMIRMSNDSFISNLSKQNEELHLALVELKTAQKELIRAERFSNLGKLSSLIIHDFRNPLSIIKGYGEMLQVLYSKPEQVQEYSRKIVMEVGRLNQFAQELLDYSRGDIRLNWVFSSLPMIFQKIEDYLAKSYQVLGIELNISYKRKEAFYVDENRLIRAILNICDNAKKAMAEGATLGIQGEIEEKEIVIIITDNGHGMDKNVLAHIFEPFYSSSHKGGTGLGMLSVKTIVEAHGGKVHIESEPNTGTTVRLTLPRNEVLPE